MQTSKRVGQQQLVNGNDYILGGNEDNNQQEIQRRRVDVILLPPTALFRKIGGGLLETGTKHGGGGALEDDDEDGVLHNVDPSRPLAGTGTTIRSGSGDHVNVFEDFGDEEKELPALGTYPNQMRRPSLTPVFERSHWE